MPTGPKGQKRLADVIGTAVRVIRIATGEEAETPEPKSSAPAELGRKGGKARAAAVTAKQRSASARKAATARWQAS